ncbi:UvrD-helicase domain-containing protein [Arhodomonas sp. AD133]|uniref:UvrD-helicase domain-containing protein n=1 Tax=Arhodomonas sp. AD133 TaxID=3415009 RepID=UPI003EBD60D3
MSQVDNAVPTPEQRAVIEHEGSCFVEACPGAGKTRVMVERARGLLRDRGAGGAIAFLSFTNAAVSELESRLQRARVLPTPAFPHFVGTFDGFVWQFLIAPFGVPDCAEAPRLIPDLGKLTVGWGRKYPLKCFCPVSGNVIPHIAKQEKVEVDKVAPAVRTQAKNKWRRLFDAGKLDFAAVRRLAVALINEREMAPRLGAALAARFGEIIVDEAQDCNPEDLEIVRWLRRSGIRTTVICDPDQAIYGFRGGVGRELRAFAKEFPGTARLPMTGNFRSSRAICCAVAAFRPGETAPDKPLGKHRELRSPVYILGYSGRSVPRDIGRLFRKLIEGHGLDPARCPVLATGWNAASRAVGAPTPKKRGYLVVKVASAVSRFHGAVDGHERRKAFEAFHEALIGPWLEDGQTYRHYLTDKAITPECWRADMLPLIQDLRFDPGSGETVSTWLERARSALASVLPDNKTPAQHLAKISELEACLCTPESTALTARSIHSVKGEEFPAACLVIGTSWAKKALDFLEKGSSENTAEEVRKLYVGVSRPEQLLMIAVPNSQKERLCGRLSAFGADYVEL